jgi:hypothetical protein
MASHSTAHSAHMPVGMRARGDLHLDGMKKIKLKGSRRKGRLSVFVVAKHMSFVCMSPRLRFARLLSLAYLDEIP